MSEPLDEVSKSRNLWHQNRRDDRLTGMLVDNGFVENVGGIEGDGEFFIGFLPQFLGKLRNTPVVRTGKVPPVTNELSEGEVGKAP